MTAFFQNYEQIKLEIHSPELTNIIILSLFILTTLLFKNRKHEKTSGLLHFQHTEQLKGLAIFLVVLGHLWVHVAKQRPYLVLSGDAVSMFLILSGFGLTISSGSKKIELKKFLRKRINRVMVPYWITTVLILLLDYIVLNKILNTKSMILTLFGVNVTTDLYHLDYVRWFITLILCWYVIFFILQKNITIYRRTLIYLFLGTGFTLSEYYFFHFGWYQFLSFPTGCIIACYYKKLNRLWDANQKTIVGFAVASMFIAIVYKMIIDSEQIWPYLVHSIPSIILTFIAEGNSILLSLSIFVIVSYMGEKGFNSRFLLFLGRYSYELFLVHGVFLIKYNMFFIQPNPLSIAVGFILFFVFILGISIIISKIARTAYLKM
ncbi:MAG: acyltransferase [Desulfobacteraceae bacterium]|nr:MAG: acyltransferase [Desulfobacteraceae bacterium]